MKWRPLAACMAFVTLVACVSASAQVGERRYIPVVTRDQPTPTITVSPTPPGPGRVCTDPRMSVRALSDGDASAVNPVPFARSIAELKGTVPPPVDGGTPRLSWLEHQTFQLRVDIVQIVMRENGAIALMVADQNVADPTAIVELPDPGCSAVIASPRYADMVAARDALIAACPITLSTTPQTVYGHATIVGAGFVDPASNVLIAPVVEFSSPDCNTIGPPSPLPTDTPRVWITNTPTRTETPTRTVTPTRTHTATSTSTVTQTSTASPTRTQTPTPTHTRTVTSTPTETPQPGAVSGSGNKEEAKVLQAGPVSWDWDYSGSGAMHAELRTVDGATLIFVLANCTTACPTGAANNTVPSGQGTVFLVRVTSNGNWTFRFTQ